MKGEQATAAAAKQAAAIKELNAATDAAAAEKGAKAAAAAQVDAAKTKAAKLAAVGPARHCSSDLGPSASFERPSSPD